MRWPTINLAGQFSQTTLIFSPIDPNYDVFHTVFCQIGLSDKKKNQKTLNHKFPASTWQTKTCLERVGPEHAQQNGVNILGKTSDDSL